MIFPITLVFMLIFQLLESKPLYKTQFIKDRDMTPYFFYRIVKKNNIFNIVYILSLRKREVLKHY